jgi:tetracycline repressor-like protein
VLARSRCHRPLRAQRLGILSPATGEHVRRSALGVNDAAIGDRNVTRGELRDDVDLGAAVDLLSWPPMYRRVITHAPLDEAAAERIVDAAVN